MWWEKCITYFWVQVVNKFNRFFDVSSLDGFTDGHPSFDGTEVDRWADIRFFAEFLGCCLIALED